ncbi:probable rRNA maturation factor [Desulfatibacillum alkenivorans DSM 16219]|uniref:Endoribonuclease YbeY n=1 Tax=Desulfatibacillum alkenivorans DSM 16219 TaxID=1121393 RepID=A0A1M6USA9_9BACT|nr:rRNA maturation RNase YbeY [Desulfatibacillum alkenivorans]SHK71946.1 probable rRNA maturation factor [Desulfatibacillum alkenivorans DSM 16219]
MEKAAQAVLSALDCPDSELSVLIVDGGRMAELHEEYVGKQGPTNVLAFPMMEGPFNEINPEIIGDVVICTDVAAKEAEDAGVDLYVRILELLIHGILHLVGHDHAEPEETALMQAKEAELFEQFKNI